MSSIYNIRIEYDAPDCALCCGNLVVFVNGIRYDFGHALCSGGSVWFDDDWCDHVETGPWSIFWPKNFPEQADLRQQVYDAVNEQIEWGCCGGCV